MIEFTLHRDQARTVQQKFFIYLQQYISLKKRDTSIDDGKVQYMIIDDLFNQVRKIFDRKLLSTAEKFKFSFNNSQAIVLYELLMNLPLDSIDVYDCTLRQMICNLIHTEISKIITMDQIQLKHP